MFGYTGGQGACTVANPCDLTYKAQHTDPLPAITTGTDLGDPYVFGGIPYTRSPGPVVKSLNRQACGLTSPYTGPGPAQTATP